MLKGGVRVGMPEGRLRAKPQPKRPRESWKTRSTIWHWVAEDTPRQTGERRRAVLADSDHEAPRHTQDKPEPARLPAMDARLSGRIGAKHLSARNFQRRATSPPFSLYLGGGPYKLARL